MPLYIYAPKSNPRHGEKLCAVCEGIGFTLGAVGIGSITPSNAPEVSARLAILQRLDGPYLRGPDGPVEITPDDVCDHIGLRTNWGDTAKSRAAFTRNVLGGMLDTAMGAYVRARNVPRDITGARLDIGSRVTDHATMRHTGTVMSTGAPIPGTATGITPTVNVMWDDAPDAPRTGTCAVDTLRAIDTGTAQHTDTDAPHTASRSTPVERALQGSDIGRA
jgi:hypothetical protein